ncbi:polycystin-2-like protein 2, partial [Convolutriloba macropyga]|uniref:polycystin-2-like protein 2 n=1 Tax=Convolutriloba macropyga TaxID=536237 RepID=UPI003F51CA6E
MSTIVMWNEIYIMLTGLIVFFVCAKMLQLMEFNRITRIFVAILKQSGPQLAAFSLMFVVIFVGFAVCGNLLFGRMIKNYCNFINSLQECGSMLLGKFTFKNLLIVQPILGGAFFVLFMTSCYMILMNVFMTILNDSIASSDRDEEDDGFSSVYYSLLLLKDLLGIGGRKSRRGAKTSKSPKIDVIQVFKTSVQRLVKFVEF